MTAPTTQETQTAPTDAQPKTNTEEINAGKLRRQLAAEREKNQKNEERIAALEKIAMAASKSTVYQEDDADDSDEPYIDQKTFKKKISREKESIKKEIREEVRAEMRQTLEEEKAREYIKQNKDFESMMSQEVLQKFVDTHPKIAEAILKMPDGFDRQRLVYENIKALKVTEKPPESSVQKKIDDNRRSVFYTPPSGATPPYAPTGDYSPAGQKAAFAKLQEMKSRLRGV